MTFDEVPTWDQFALLVSAHRLDEARKLAMRLCQLQPDAATGYAMMSVVTKDERAFSESRRFAREAIQRKPEWYYPYYLLAWAILGDKQYVPRLDNPFVLREHEAARVIEAKGFALEALRLEPENASNYQLLSFCLNSQQRFAEAVQAARDGLNRNPLDVGCRIEEIRALFLLGRYTEVVNRASDGLSFAPEESGYHHWLARTYVQMGRMKAALEHAREAIRLDPTDDSFRRSFWASLVAQRPVARFIVRTLYLGQRIYAVSSTQPWSWAYWGFPIAILTTAMFLAKYLPGNISGWIGATGLTVWLSATFFAFASELTFDAVLDALMISQREGRAFLTRQELRDKATITGWVVLIALFIAQAAYSKHFDDSGALQLPLTGAFWAGMLAGATCIGVKLGGSKTLGELLIWAHLTGINLVASVALWQSSIAWVPVIGTCSIAVSAVFMLICGVYYVWNRC